MEQTFRATDEGFIVHDSDETSNRSRQKEGLERIYSGGTTAQ